MTSSDDDKQAPRPKPSRRKTIAILLAGTMLLTAVTCAKILVRIKWDPHGIASNGDHGSQLTPEQLEQLGYVAARTFVAPADNPLAAERFREIKRLSRIGIRSKRHTKPTKKESEEQLARAVIARKPFVLYVAVAAVIHFLIGFVAAMHVGYRPHIFGARVCLKELDPFPESGGDGLGNLGALKTPERQLEDLIREDEAAAEAEEAAAKALADNEEAEGESATDAEDSPSSDESESASQEDASAAGGDSSSESAGDESSPSSSNDAPPTGSEDLSETGSDESKDQASELAAAP